MTFTDQKSAGAYPKKLFGLKLAVKCDSKYTSYGMKCVEIFNKRIKITAKFYIGTFKNYDMLVHSDSLNVNGQTLLCEVPWAGFGGALSQPLVNSCKKIKSQFNMKVFDNLSLCVLTFDSISY